MRQGFAISKYVLLTARADRMFLAQPLVMAAVAAFALFLASTAAVESREMALALTAAGLRLTAALGLMLFSVFQLRQAYANREINAILARAIGRNDFILYYAMGLALLVLFQALAAGVILFLVTALPIGGSVPDMAALLPGLLLWSASLFMELMVLAAASLFFGLLLANAATAALMSIVFYVTARLVGSLLSAGGFESAGADRPGLADTPRIMMEGVAHLLPRLDLFTQSGWLVHGLPDGRILGILALQSLVYTALLVILTMLDFSRKRL